MKDEQTPTEGMEGESKADHYYKLFEDNTEALCAYHILKESNYPVFLTGKAGTGKSTFIELARTLPGPFCQVVAPTGIAARNVDGTTINSLFNFPPRFILPTDEFIYSINFNKDHEFELYHTHLMIIDEVSMVNAATLDCIDRTLQMVCDCEKPFGGKKVLFVGDPFQLPPVLNKEEKGVLKKLYKSEYFFDSEVFQHMNPVKIELQTIYRQKDEVFLRILNDIRSYTNIDESIALLNQSCLNKIDNNKTGSTNSSITLAFTNYEVDSINQKELGKLSEQLYTFTAKTNGLFDWGSVVAERVLQLKKGARIMLTKNHKYGLYVNGSLGNVQEIDEKKIIITTDEGKTFELEQETWTTMKYESKKKGNKWVAGYVETGTMKQYPIKLAWAITVHKSQGLTFDNVYLLNNNASFAAGQIYVALSRCRSLEGLKLYRKLKPADILIDKEVAQFYKCINDNVRVERIIDEIISEQKTV